MIKKFRISKLLVGLFILIMSIISLFPFYIMIIMGTHKNEDLFKGIHLLPGNYLRENFQTIVSTNFFQYYANSFIVTLCATTGILVVSVLTGYAFAKMRFKGKTLLFSFILATLMIPNQVGLIGFLIEMKNLKWTDTFLPLIIPPMASGFGVFWMKQYIEASVPNELLEAATMDGCGLLKSLFLIVVPAIKPALITLFLLYFLWTWNDYLTPLVVLSDQSKYTIPLSISIIGQLHRTDYAARILCLSISTLPILILFGFGSKYLIKGMVAGAIKG